MRYTFCWLSAVMEDAALRVQHNGAALREAVLITDLDAPLKRDMMIFVNQQLPQANKEQQLFSPLNLMILQSALDQVFNWPKESMTSPPHLAACGFMSVRVLGPDVRHTWITQLQCSNFFLSSSTTINGVDERAFLTNTTLAEMRVMLKCPGLT